MNTALQVDFKCNTKVNCEGHRCQRRSYEAIYLLRSQSILVFNYVYSRGSRGGGAPGARAPPLTLGFEAPKLSILLPYLIFP